MTYKSWYAIQQRNQTKQRELEKKYETCMGN